MLRCGQNEIKMRSARGSYMKNFVKPETISSFVVGRTLIKIRSARGSYKWRNFCDY